MKKLWAILLAMALLCAAAHAEGAGAVLDYVEGELNLTPETVEQAFSSDALNMILSQDGQAVVTWTDAAQSMAYALTGPQADMAEIYSRLIPLADWDACALYDGGERLMGCDGTDAAALKDYTASFAAYFSGDAQAAADAPAQSDEFDAAADYVLNTNTKRFHFPTCPSVTQMKPENRQSYTGSREDLIAEGYKPCGNCKP